MKLHLKVTPFGWVLIAAWLSIVIPVILPGTLWYKMHDFHIADGTWNEPGAATIERTIRQRMSGVWASTILEQDNGGIFSMVPECSREVPINLDPEQRLPSDLTFKSMISDKCKVPPGNYQIRALMVIEPFWFPTKKLTFRSNVFRVLPDKEE